MGSLRDVKTGDLRRLEGISIYASKVAPRVCAMNQGRDLKAIREIVAAKWGLLPPNMKAKFEDQAHEYNRRQAIGKRLFCDGKSVMKPEPVVGDKTSGLTTTMDRFPPPRQSSLAGLSGTDRVLENAIRMTRSQLSYRPIRDSTRVQQNPYPVSRTIVNLPSLTPRASNRTTESSTQTDALVCADLQQFASLIKGDNKYEIISSGLSESDPTREVYEFVQLTSFRPGGESGIPVGLLHVLDQLVEAELPKHDTPEEALLSLSNFMLHAAIVGD